MKSYFNLTPQKDLANAILLALAVEREEVIKRSSNERFDQRLAPCDRAHAAKTYSIRNTIKKEADLLIEAASTGEISREVETLVERFLKPKIEHGMLETWVEEKALRWLM